MTGKGKENKIVRDCQKFGDKVNTHPSKHNTTSDSQHGIGDFENSPLSETIGLRRHGGRAVKSEQEQSWVEIGV